MSFNLCFHLLPFQSLPHIKCSSSAIANNKINMQESHKERGTNELIVMKNAEAGCADGLPTLNAVVVEMQVLQVAVEERNHAELVVGQLQVHQRGQVEHGLGDAFVAQLVVVQPHERQVSEAVKVVSA